MLKGSRLKCAKTNKMLSTSTLLNASHETRCVGDLARQMLIIITCYEFQVEVHLLELDFKIERIPLTLVSLCKITSSG